MLLVLQRILLALVLMRRLAVLPISLETMLRDRQKRNSYAKMNAARSNVSYDLNFLVASQHLQLPFKTGSVT